MLLTYAKPIPHEDFVSLLRLVRVQGHSRALPYATSPIHILHLPFEAFKPPGRYVMRRKVDMMAAVLRQLHEARIEAPVWFQTEDSETKWWPFLPPIVEFSTHSGFVMVDGLHRAYAAHKYRLQLPCVVIDTPSSPVVPGDLSWADVEELDIAPVRRVPDEVRRDFNGVFPGA